MKPTRPMIWLPAILILGITLRLVWIGCVNTRPISDFKHYHDLAMSLRRTGRYTLPGGLDYIKVDTPYVRRGRHYPTAFRPPGYSFFLVAVYFLHPSLLMAKLANVALSVIWILCMYLLGRYYFEERVGLWAALLTAIFPSAISYSSVLGTEILSATLLAMMVTIYAYLPRESWRKHLILGVLAAFLSLVKPYFMVLPALYFVLLWWQTPDKEQSSRLAERLLPIARAVAVFTLVMGAVISPWTLRNYLVFHRFVPISTNGDFILYCNNNDRSDGTNMDVMEVPNSLWKTRRILNEQGEYHEADAMKLARREAIRWIKGHPGEYVLLGFRRLANSYLNVGGEIWEWTIESAELRFPKSWGTPIVHLGRTAGVILVGNSLLYMLLVCFQFVRRHPLNLMHRINLLFTAFISAIIFVSEGQARYLFPLFPFFLIATAWVIDHLVMALMKEPIDSV